MQDSGPDSATFRRLSFNGATDPFSNPLHDTRYYNGSAVFHAEGVGNNAVQCASL